MLAVRKLCTLLLPLLMLLCGSHITLAATEAVLETPTTGPRAIGEGVLLLEDPARSLSLEDALNPSAPWEPSTESVFNRGYTTSAWWLRFAVKNTQAERDWMLEVAYAPLDGVDVHIQREDGTSKYLQMGDKRPFSERPVQHRYFVVPLALEPGETVWITLRVHSDGSVQAPINLWRRADFHSHDISLTALQGLYYGGLLIIAIYNLLIYTVLRERYYLYYVGWVASMFWFMISLNGWAFQFLWPNATQWNDVSIVTSLALVVLFGYLFAGAFLGVPTWTPWFRWLHYSLVTTCLVLFMAGLVLPYRLVGHLAIPFAAFGCVWGLTVGLVAMQRRVASAHIYVVAWALLLVGGIIMALNKIHLLPRNLLTDYAIQLGSLLEVLLLSFALAERINRERQLRHQAQHAALETQRRANEELEQRVQERTVALEEANLKLRELSDTDQLTGLKNRRFLNLYIEKEFARAQRYQHPIAVLMIDVDHFKSINDNYGHPLGDDCLEEVANRIRKEMRWPSDTAARYGGEEFCVVLPETTSDGAQIVAERIRHKIEADPITTRSRRLSLTVSVGVHVAIPAPDSSAADFISQADAALYQAKQSGRNRVINSTRKAG
jgi:two-component system, sensor histidine kinase LadS